MGFVNGVPRTVEVGMGPPGWPVHLPPPLNQRYGYWWCLYCKQMYLARCYQGDPTDHDLLHFPRPV